MGECLAIGLSEELVWRAYLVPRMEAVIRSTWKAAVFSVVLFALMHLHHGVVGVTGNVVPAIIWTIAFCLTRRIWPLVVSHAISDFVMSSHLAAMIGT
jgi:membrane protease YdiL (CAAX protease family)